MLRATSSMGQKTRAQRPRWLTPSSSSASFTSSPALSRASLAITTPQLPPAWGCASIHLEGSPYAMACIYPKRGSVRLLEVLWFDVASRAS